MKQRSLKWSSPVAIVAMLTSFGISYPAFAADWWETVKIKGDLRYRHEMIDEQAKDARHRHRLRARIGIFGEVSPYTNIGVQLATGGSNPVSTNQTLDDAFSTKPIGLDLAYFEMTHPRLPGFTLTGGKFKNPFYKPGDSELLWDSDWNPEGGAIDFTRAMDDVSLNLIGAGLWIDERSSGDDSYLLAGQGVVRMNLDEKKTSVAVGAGFFNYVNTRGFEVFHDPEDPMGNSVVSVVASDESAYYYANEFELAEFFGEVTHTFEELPVTVMGDLVINTATDSPETGWLVGIRVGKAKKSGSWEGRYIYREVEKDAVVGMFTDSDFRGGGTDASGHEIGSAVQLAKNTAFNVSYFINKIGLQRENQDDFKRLQVDLQLKF